jgi:apolipoprotein N-acyltransferase
MPPIVYALLAVLSSGAIIVASFPPWGFRALIFIALTPWLFSLSKASTLRKAVFQGIGLSMAMSILGFYWVGYVLHEFGQIPWALAGLGLVLFSTFGQPQFVVFAPAYLWLSRKRAHCPSGLLQFSWGLASALLYTGIDWLIPKLFHDTLGHSQYSAPWLRQSADLFGAHGLTFIIFWINDSLVELACSVKNRKEPSLWPALKRSFPSLIACALTLFGLTLYGSAREKQINSLVVHAPRSVRGAVIQANIGDFDKIAAHHGIRGAADFVIDHYFAVSDRALSAKPRPDFLVWPETAYPSTFRNPMTSDELARDERVEDFVKDRRFPLLFGGYDRSGGKDYNALFALTPPISSPVDATLNGFGDNGLLTYRKNILLLFGEYVPFTEDSPMFRHYFPQVGNFGRGAGSEVLEVPIATHGIGSIKLSPVICYEVLFPYYVLNAANKGSELILNITNDSWFGPFGEPELHLALSTFRSIETRLPQLRATNTGVSALIEADGTIHDPTGTFVEQVLSVQIPLTGSIWTLMKAWGDWFGGFALVSALTLIALSMKSMKPGAVT